MNSRMQQMIKNAMMKRAMINRKKRDGEAGFTMIELIIVVLVIGILAAMALPQLGDVAGVADQNVDRYEAASVQVYQRCLTQAANANVTDVAGLCGTAPAAVAQPE